VTSTRVLVVSLGLLAVGSTASATDVTGPLTFVGIVPCRIIETRNGFGFSGSNGPPALVAGATRTFQITGTVTGVPAQCGVPSTALAVSVNFTVTNFDGAGDIRVFPSGLSAPLASVLNYRLENIANATTVPLGPSGGGERGITVQADVSGTDFIADVNGYYVPRPFTLESGQTLRGTYTANAASGGAIMAATFTFPLPLASAPAAPFANFIPAGGAATTSCPGSSANPTALPGNLCVYEASFQNRTFQFIFGPGSAVRDTAHTFGAGVTFTSTGLGNAWSYGTWAVTAP
jgi:hypothetical protein